VSHPVLRISASTLARNIEVIRSRVAPSDLMLIVKDDAYRHGAGWVAGVAKRAGVAWIGTYDIPTALQLRDELGPDIGLFAWATSADDEISAALRRDVDLGVGSLEYLERVICQAGQAEVTARVHLKIDTGLHRSGIAPEAWTHAVRRALSAQDEGLISLVGVWSHLAEASDEEDDAAQAIFLRAAAYARECGAQIEHTHLTASAATWARPDLRGTLVRVGAFCYGVRSADGADIDGVEPIATLSACVSAVDDDVVAINLGSLDGLPSTLADKVSVGTPAGARALVGISLTHSTVETWPGAHVGDEVRIFGAGAWAERSTTGLAEAIETVGEEILTRITPHVRREYTN